MKYFHYLIHFFLKFRAVIYFCVVSFCLTISWESVASSKVMARFVASYDHDDSCQYYVSLGFIYSQVSSFFLPFV